MNASIQPFSPNPGSLLMAERGGGSIMLQLAARFARQGQVFVLDGGNRFNAYKVAHAIRLQTVRLYQTQTRIRIARAFTCHEMVVLLQKTPLSPAPILIVDMLATFYDDAVSGPESQRLLRLSLEQIRRLQKHNPVVVSVSPAPSPDRGELVSLVKHALEPLQLEKLMGKTTPTINDVIREAEAALSRFRKVLHPGEKTLFDSLIAKAKKHIAAISEAAYLLPIEMIQMAIAFEQEKENLQRDERLAALERKLKSLERRLPDGK